MVVVHAHCFIFGVFQDYLVSVRVRMKWAREIPGPI